MTVYYVKQDNTVWGCGDPDCCGEYYEEIDEQFHECYCTEVDPENITDHLQSCMGGGPIIKWRKAKRLEVQAWVEGKGEGFSEGYLRGVQYQRERNGENK